MLVVALTAAGCCPRPVSRRGREASQARDLHRGTVERDVLPVQQPDQRRLGDEDAPPDPDGRDQLLGHGLIGRVPAQPEEPRRLGHGQHVGEVGQPDGPVRGVGDLGGFGLVLRDVGDGVGGGGFHR